jgi:hypothetical protein
MRCAMAKATSGRSHKDGNSAALIQEIKMETNNTTSKARPTLYAYSVREGEHQNAWTRIGAAWAHKDGKGFSLKLDCLPTNGQISLRLFSDNQ